MTRIINKCLLGFVLSLWLTAHVLPAYADFGPAATAREWCKKRTLHYLEKHGYIPYNWEATTYIKGDDYVTQGIWRVDVDNIEVQCTSNKHARRSSDHYKILNIHILDDTKASSKH